MLVSQALIPFSEKNKWGYKIGERIVIKPEYDSAFNFDKTNQIALVANKSVYNKEVNPITGEEISSLDFFFINKNNNKLKILADNFPDSIFTFSYQQELQNNYIDSSNYFKILFQNKLYLMSKKGNQLSIGYDNISETKTKGYFETENNLEYGKKFIRMKGIIDSVGLVVVKCKYHRVIINPEDSSIYCCSAVYNSKLNDDVFNYQGKLIYTNKNHIEFSSKKIHIMKLYVPNETFVYENSETKKLMELDGTLFIYLGNHKALLVKNDIWYFMDLISQKKQKVDKEMYYQTLYKFSKY